MAALTVKLPDDWYDRTADILIERGYAIKVVRCSECVHFLSDTEYCKEHNKSYCEFDNTIKAKNHFCSYGERRSDDE